MEVVNEILPASEERLRQMQEQGPEGPVFMVNLLKFREKAVYEDGRETALTGREAYNLYGAAVMKLLPAYGGKIRFAADVSFLSLGQVEELWDEVVIVEYPGRGALWRMSTSPEWLEASVHRTAGLAGQLNVETVGIRNSSV